MVAGLSIPVLVTSSPRLEVTGLTLRCLVKPIAGGHRVSQGVLLYNLYWLLERHDSRKDSSHYKWKTR
ncbi:hypothetical protein AALO_G00133880 [Alosa alosa]|uniref:Uncharacterized protein n=1 Tax=Alosa alosa TaxID=278164 RepID=A0AAV6GI89_9TELE|nr:hypothetical protein AALO_G00133880 [Alosa alosa]